jgi:bifunctional UDP-N-acetylglucosamine pyrophosphorylase/glucosamine-1-phosphate N-acetyltransferase
MKVPVSIAILAAGLGTRMRSKKAKVLHRAGGRALVEHVVESALQLAPPERIVVVVGHQAEEVQALLAPKGVKFAHQPEQKGTGDALAKCREELEPAGGHVIVLYGDCPLLRPETLRALFDSELQAGGGATLITTILEDPRGYGRIIRDARGGVAAIVEQKAATPEQLAIREINSGIYCFRADLLWKHVGEITPNPASGEMYLTDMAEILVKHGHRVTGFVVEDPAELIGINTRVELAEIDRILRDRKVRELMLGGVTIEKPETVSIDSGVEIGQDTIVGAFAQIAGNTVIGEDCRVGACAIIRDSRMANGAVVEAFTVIDGSTLDSGARAGPFARLRMNSVVEQGAVVGNFVELKKTRLGASAKAQHLAYLGDSSIGSRANIGAGTITCNYDGEKKHETHIASDAFVGSNSTLVAPVEIGEGSYIAAGSVITSDVPPDTLALGRARQTDKPGWPSERKRRKKAAEE